MTEKAVCPVCNAKQQKVTDITCPKCSFAYAYVTYFASEASRELWQEKVRQAKERTIQRRNNDRDISLLVRRGKVALLTPDGGRLAVFYSKGSASRECENVIQYVANEMNEYILYQNGKVEAEGDRSLGLCDVAELKNIVSIASSGSCLFAVDCDGQIFTRGSIANSIARQMATWMDIIKVTGSGKLVLGITKGGRICAAAENREMVTRFISLQGVWDACVFEESCLILLEDGTVTFVGKEGDPRAEVGGWKDIISIALDGTYAVGLDRTGKVWMAGQAKNKIQDVGRIAAAEWSHMRAISSAPFTIAGIDEENRIHIVGSFSGDIEAINRRWSEYSKDTGTRR